jgi:hypothetical protein
MDPFGTFGGRNMRGGGQGVEFYASDGRALSRYERKDIAKRKGICINCGVRTHLKSRVVFLTAVTDANVYQGICIRCRPEAVPEGIMDAFFAPYRLSDQYRFHD